MWEPQQGCIIETGIDGTGTTPDLWKYMRKEIQELGIPTPIRVQMDIDKLCDGDAIPIRKPVDTSGDSFLDELTALCRRHDRYIVGPNGIVVASADEARKYNQGHRPINGFYEQVSGTRTGCVELR